MTTFAQIKMHHATRAKADKLATQLEADYPALTLDAVAGDEIEHATYTHDLEAFVVSAIATSERTGDEDEDETTIEIYRGDKVPSIAELLDTCAEEGINPEGEQKARASGSVVPEAYRVTYREASSTGRSCGDWLAEQLASDTLNADGNLVIDDFVAVLEANAVDMSGKWAQMRFTQTRGWQGRFRMNGRQLLEKAVAKSGIYFDAQGNENAPNPEWLADARTRHAKWLAKEAKRDQAAADAIKSSVEG